MFFEVSGYPRWPGVVVKPFGGSSARQSKLLMLPESSWFKFNIPYEPHEHHGQECCFLGQDGSLVFKKAKQIADPRLAAGLCCKVPLTSDNGK